MLKIITAEAIFFTSAPIPGILSATKIVNPIAKPL